MSFPSSAMPKPPVLSTAEDAHSSLERGEACSLLHGDSVALVRSLPSGFANLVVTSPPYCMGKEYESSSSVEDFVIAHKAILPEIVRMTAPGGSICWQVGYHMRDQVAFPLDFAVYEIMRDIPGVFLRNRIIWNYAHGLHARKRFSGRHEVILWFTKGDISKFNLDAVRVPQKYPGKRSYKGPNKGEYSGNPLGKNPSDVWEIPNVKGNHIEKSRHPCQFPVALVQRLVRALTNEGDCVFDPFMGSGSTGVAALLEQRRFLGIELKKEYVEIAQERVKDTLLGKARVRPIDRPIYIPSERSAVARRPEHFHVDHTRSLNDGDN